ncbi:MAG: aldolase [Alphaproteobacteria bacterium]|nr:aldolase [Alphaproteobacteria bacterium]
MRDNPIKPRLAKGGNAYGTMIFEFFTPGLAQICKSAGAEFVLYDMEHSAVSIETVRAQISFCRGIGLVPMVRVPATQYDYISRALDAGAMGIMVPMVETPEQAAFIVQSTRYPPAGRRGAAFGFAHDDFEGGPVTDKIRAAHDRTLVICLIETAKGIANADAIAAVPGVDVCWLGHFDLTNFMGIPGAFTDKRFLKAVDTLLAACRKHGKTPGFMAADDAWAKDYLGKGFRMVAYGVDAHLMQGALRSGIDGMRKLAGPKPAKPRRG